MIPEAIQRDEIALKYWEHYKTLLESQGKWRDEYAAYFSMGIRAFADYLRITNELDEIRDKGGNAHLMLSIKGVPYQHPLITVQLAKINVVRAWSMAFGLNPLAEAKVKTHGLGLGDLFNLLKGPEEAQS